MKSDRHTCQFFSEEEINASLEEDSKDSPYEVKVSYSNTGTDLNSFRYLKEFASENKHIFRHTEPLISSHSKKKVIYCALSDSALKGVEIGYFASLMMYRALYLRVQGEDGKARIHGPYRQLKDFLKDRAGAQASKQQVLRSLGDQHSSASQFIILDQTRYSKALKILSERAGLGKFHDAKDEETWGSRWISNEDLQFLKNQSLDVLDLSFLPITKFQQIADVVDKDKIQKVKLSFPNKEDIRKLLLLFPNLETIEVSRASKSWIEVGLSSWFPLSRKLNLVLNHYQDGNLRLPGSVELNQLTIVSSSALTFSSLGAKVTALFFNGVKPLNLRSLTIDLYQVSTLVELHINHFHLWGGFNQGLFIPRNNALQILKIKNSPGNKDWIDFSRLPKLKNFVFEDSSKDILGNNFLIRDPKCFSYLNCWEGESLNHPDLQRVEIGDPSNLDLTMFSSERTRVLACYAPSEKVKTITLNAEDFNDRQDFVLLAGRYKQVDFIIIKNATKKWVRQFLPMIREEASVTLDQFQDEQLILPMALNITKLRVVNAPKLVTILAAANTNVRQLEMVGCSLFDRCNLEKLNNLSSLRFENCKKRIALLPPKKNTITELAAIRCKFLEFDFINLFKQLEKLILEYTESDFSQSVSHYVVAAENFSKHSSKVVQENLFKDYCLKHVEIFENKSDGVLRLDKVTKLEAVFLSGNIQCILPTGIIGKSFVGAPDAQRTDNRNIQLMFYNNFAVEAWMASGERTTFSKVDFESSVFTNSVYCNFREYFYPPKPKSRQRWHGDDLWAAYAEKKAQENSSQTTVFRQAVEDIRPVTELETLMIRQCQEYWPLSKFNASGLAHLKKLELYIAIYDSVPLEINLTNCKQLRELKIELGSGSSQQVTLNLHGCVELHMLTVGYPTNVNYRENDNYCVSIAGLNDCVNLHYVKMNAVNSKEYQGKFPADCIYDLFGSKPFRPLGAESLPIPPEVKPQPQQPQFQPPDQSEPFDPTFIIDFCKGSLKVILGCGLLVELFSLLLNDQLAQSIGIDNPIRSTIIHSDAIPSLWHAIAIAASAIWDFILALPSYLYSAVNLVWNFIEAIPSYLNVAINSIYPGIVSFPILHPVLLACAATCLLVYIAYRCFPNPFNKVAVQASNLINSLASESKEVKKAEEVKENKEMEKTKEIEKSEDKMPLQEQRRLDDERSQQELKALQAEEKLQSPEKKVEMSSEELRLRKQQAQDRFYNALIAKTQKNPLRSLVKDILEAKTQEPLAPLVEFKTDQDPMEIDSHIIRQLNEWKHEYSFDHHLYVHSPEEFLEYYRPGKIEKGRVVVEEKGPLKEFFSDGNSKKVLVINLATFSVIQRAGFQSLLDQPPFITVGNEKKSETIYLPGNVQVILLTPDNASLGEAFRSRCKPWVLHDDFFKAAEVAKKQQLISDPLSLDPDEASVFTETKEVKEVKEVRGVEVDAYNNPAWEDAIAEIIFEDQEVKFSADCPLRKAWDGNRPLIVYNPPKDDSFKRFKHRVNVERKIDLFKGKLERVPEGFCIKVMIKSEKNSLVLDNVHIFSKPEDEAKFTKNEREYLGIQDMHRCYKETWVDEKGNAKSVQGGLLKSYDPGTQVFYIVGSIKQCYWEKLIAEIKQKYPLKEFNFILAPGASIEGVARNSYLARESKSLDQASVYVSNEPSFLAETLAKKHQGLVIDVHPGMSFGDLMSEMECQSGGGFKYSKRLILTELTKEQKNTRDLLASHQVGQTIVLNGELSTTVYLQLLPLLDRARQSDGRSLSIACNGKKITITGQLILVMPAHAAEKSSAVPVQGYFYNWSDYHRLFDGLDSRNKELLDKIQEFYELANHLPQQREGRPEKPHRSYYRLANMLGALQQDNPLHKLNPIKDIFLYDYPKDKNNYEDMADYAYLNVIGKYLFSKELKGGTAPVRINKLKEFKKRFNIKSRADIEKHAWHLLNCFDGAELHKILGSSLSDALTFHNFPTLKITALIKLEEIFNSFTDKEMKYLPQNSDMSLTETKYSKQPRHLKQLEHLGRLVKDKLLVVLIGSPGGGKTHAIRQLLGGVGQYYEGEHGFMQWLEKGDLPFFWDEFNMATERQLVILGALRRGDKRVRYFNKEKNIDEFYDLAKHKPVIAAGNPVSGGQGMRYFSEITQDIGVIIYFEDPSDEFYLSKILDPRLDERFKKYNQDMLFAFHLIKKYNEFIPRSTRDLKNLVRCFFSLLKKQDSTTEEIVKQVLLKACVLSFSGSIKDTKERKNFIEELRQHFNVQTYSEEKQDSSTLIKLTDKISIPLSKKYFVDAVEQFLWMRLETLIERANTEQAAPLDIQTQMIIVEGDPGLGKSTYIRAIVDKHRLELEERARAVGLRLSSGSSEKEKDKTELAVIKSELAKKSHVISVGSASANAMLIESHENEGIAIGDEGNLDETVEALTNQLLGGVDEKRRPVDKRGFAYIRSQNASSEEGRPSASPADLNRSLFIYKDSYDDADLEAFVSNKGCLEYPDSYRKAYREAAKLRPEINMRTFHVTLEEMAKEVMAERKAAESQRSQRASVLGSGLGLGLFSTETSRSKVVAPPDVVSYLI